MNERKWSYQQDNIFHWFETGNVRRTVLDIYATGRATSLPPNLVEEVYNRNLIVRARAGTGKTTTIIEGANRAPEKKILLAAYNKKIAEELSSRIQNPNVTAKTLHSVGYAAVRQFRERIQVSFNDDRATRLTDAVCGNRAPDTIKRLVSKLHTKGREITPHASMLGDLTNIAYEFDCIPDEQWESTFPLDYIEQKALDAMELASQIKSGRLSTLVICCSSQSVMDGSKVNIIL